MLMKSILLFFALTLICYQQSLAQFVGHYDEKWKIIRTDHFDIVVSAQHHDLGLYYAKTSEAAYQNLSPIFKSAADERIVIILNDTTDVANGYATRIPYPHIMAYTVPVHEHDSLSEAGDWPRELMTHELTHILQLEPAHGFYKYLKPVFGNIVSPNMFMPLWWKEGMSVEMETQFSPRGRLRSTYQDANIRGMVLENKLFQESLPKANEILPSWPYGNRPYLFGSIFFSYLHQITQNPSLSGELANKQGAQIPYYIEDSLMSLANSKYEDIYLRALRNIENISLEQIQAIKKVPLTKLKSLHAESHSSHHPSYSPNFKLLAYIQNIEGDKKLQIVNENYEPLNLKNAPTGDITGLVFHPVEKKILFSKIDLTDSQHLYSDLYIYDLDHDEVNKVTTLERARNPQYSSSGEHILYISTSGGRTLIRIMNLNTKNIETIAEANFSHRYETAIFWDDNTILAPLVDNNGDFSIVKIDLKTKKSTSLSLKMKQMHFLKKRGQSLYFVSSENGVNNLYVTDDLRTARPLTNVLTGIWTYEPDPEKKSAWVTLLTTNGFEVQQADLSEPPQKLPVITKYSDKQYHFKEQNLTSSNTEYPTEDYSASSYLWPQYWIPFAATSSSSNGVFIQAQTSGFDPLKKHQYAVLASYDSELNKANFNGSYINSTQKIPFQLSSIAQSRTLGLQTRVVETTTHSASLMPSVFDYSKHLSLNVGLQIQNVKYQTSTQHVGPYIQAAYKNYEQNIFQISPESGWGGLIRLEKHYKAYDENNSSARDYEKLIFNWQVFLSKWLPKHHAIKTKLSGLITFSEVLVRYGSGSYSSFGYSDDDSIQTLFVMRGYSQSQFFGRSLWNANIEYRFPIMTIEEGSGTDPYFIKRLSGAIVADGIGVEGSALTARQTYQNLKLDESFWSAGAELKLETTVGYILPMNVIVGFYIPNSPMLKPDSQFALGLQIGGF